MANGQILRGEIYWVCVDDSVGSEQQTGRPALIISGNKSNEKKSTVIVAYLTTGGYANPQCVSVNYVGKPERVLCDQVRTLDKQRLTRYVGKLNDSELRRVSGGLAVSMCIPTGKDLIELEPEETTENEELISLKAEAEMWKRLYEKTMDQLVEFKVSADLQMRIAQRTPVVEVVEPPKVEPVIEVVEPVIEEEVSVKEDEPVVEFEETPEKVDLNSCTVEDLKKCGCTESVARLIIAGQPYKFVEDLRRIPGITNIGFGILKHKVYIAEAEEETVVEPEVTEEPEVVETPVVESEKVDINTASSREIHDKLGLSMTVCYSIVGTRVREGFYKSIEDLKNVPRFTEYHWKNFHERFTVSQPPVVEEPEEEEQSSEIVNINTATAKEFMEKLGIQKTYAYRINSYRNKNGPFVAVEELLEVKGVPKAVYEKNKHRLTVGESEAAEEKEPETQEEANWLDQVETPAHAEPFAEKLNVNKANVTELMEVGFSKPVAGRIVATVKKFGPFRSLDELLTVDGMRGKTLRKLRDKLEV